MRCVALLSGGLDSFVAAALAREEHELVLSLTCDYGQRAAARELGAAAAQAEWLGCPHQTLQLPWLGVLGGSALTDPARELPELAAEDLDSEETSEASARAVWVPNRNGVLVNVAAAYAESQGAEAVLCGFNAEEAAAFPDNSPEFMQAAETFWRHSTLTGLRLLSPTARMDKAEIVRQAQTLGVPLELVWSCYRGASGHCWTCESCHRLRRALEQAGAWLDYCRAARISLDPNLGI
ncbi:MAG: 7-cyano-7-deazaguanine synthase QueC [candidate division WS1 bacterium]|jgi:7-cyano-7-deazaguanine synthase|nr:7-cyano-7-deazaguanine synthase QueC [candidate division WS1 bacterium]